MHAMHIVSDAYPHLLLVACCNFKGILIPFFLLFLSLLCYALAYRLLSFFVVVSRSTGWEGTTQQKARAAFTLGIALDSIQHIHTNLSEQMMHTHSTNASYDTHCRLIVGHMLIVIQTT